jgi:hypothetical protein
MAWCISPQQTQQANIRDKQGLSHIRTWRLPISIPIGQNESGCGLNLRRLRRSLRTDRMGSTRDRANRMRHGLRPACLRRVHVAGGGREGAAIAMGERGTCWCKSRPKGSSTQQRTKEPLRRTTPSSTTANSTTTTTTKQKLEKTTIAYYFGVFHHLMLVPSITMTLLYI